MKKLILVLVLVTAVTVVLGVPAAIGLFVQKGISSTVEDRLPDARVAWDRGWFRSGVRIDDEDFNARLNFRHASPGAGWVSVDGLVNLVETAAAIVGLGGRQIGNHQTCGHGRQCTFHRSVLLEQAAAGEPRPRSSASGARRSCDESKCGRYRVLFRNDRPPRRPPVPQG